MSDSFKPNKFIPPGKGGFHRTSYGDRLNANRRDRDDARPIMHPAVCATCKASCTVPFVPNGEKPVYCRNCFRSTAPTHCPAVRPGRPEIIRQVRIHDEADPRLGNLKKQLEEVHLKLDAILKLVNPKPLEPTV
jgi:CxxC-x17-CxxC domain-containing protein